MTRTSSIRYDGDSVRFILDKHVRLQCGFEHNIYTKLDTLELKLAEQQTAMGFLVHRYNYIIGIVIVVTL